MTDRERERTSEPINPREHWWREAPPPRPGLLARLRPEPATPPATLLSLPAPLQASPPVVLAIPTLPPAVFRTCRQEITLDTPAMQKGFVKRWGAQAVDIQSLFHPPPPSPTISQAGKASAGEPAGVAEIVSAARLRREALARRLAVVLQPPPEVLLHAHGPLAWPEPLFPYQQTGVRALLHSPTLLLGDEMGLGKTVQAIAALRILAFQRQVTRALIVAPASLLTQWQRELARWAPELRVMTVYGDAEERRWQWQCRTHITLTSYETLRADAMLAGTLALQGDAGSWDAVVLDEAQKIKNRESEIAQVCKRLPRHRAWALTGTPLENRTADVASILEFVTGTSVPTDGPALRAMLNEYQLRRRKADVLRDLPPKLITDLLLPMTPA